MTPFILLPLASSGDMGLLLYETAWAALEGQPLRIGEWAAGFPYPRLPPALADIFIGGVPLPRRARSGSTRQRYKPGPSFTD